MIHSFRGNQPKIHPSVFLTPSSEVIGDVEIGENASLWFCCVVRGDVHSIRIGRDTNLQDGVVVHGTFQKWPVLIGNGVTVGHSATLHGCTIGDYVLVGMGAIILDGSEIGSETIIGAGALVTQAMKVPPRSLVLGSPGKVVRELRAEEIKSIYDSVDRYKNYVSWYREGGVLK